MAAPMPCESMSIAIEVKKTYCVFVNLRYSDNSVPLKTTCVGPLEWFICLS